MDAAQQDLVARYAAAFERYDVDALRGAAARGCDDVDAAAGVVAASRAQIRQALLGSGLPCKGSAWCQWRPTGHRRLPSTRPPVGGRPVVGARGGRGRRWPDRRMDVLPLMLPACFRCLVCRLRRRARAVSPVLDRPGGFRRESMSSMTPRRSTGRSRTSRQQRPTRRNRMADEQHDQAQATSSPISPARHAARWPRPGARDWAAHPDQRGRASAVARDRTQGARPAPPCPGRQRPHLRRRRALAARSLKPPA